MMFVAMNERWTKIVGSFVLLGRTAETKDTHGRSVMRTSKLYPPESTTNFLSFSRTKVSSLLTMVLMIIAVNVICVPHAIALDSADNDQSGISRGLETKLERQIIPALLSNDRETFRFEFSEVIARVTETTAKNIEVYGKRNGIESLRIALFEAWQDTVLEGKVPADFKLKLPVLKYLVAGMEESTSKLTQEVERHELTTTKRITKDWRQSRSFFFDVAGFKSQITELEKMEEYLAGALATYRKSPNPKQEVIAMLELFDANGSSLSEFQNRVLEKEAVFRLQRFRRAAKMILEPSDFEDGLVSALFITEDAKALRTFFDNATELNDPQLKQPGLAQSIIQTIDDVRKSGNPVVEKASLLSTGLNQWRRGRYGIGPLANGLLKARSQNWRGGIPQNTAGDSLRMPETPIAISQYLGEDSGEGFERRHYYTWDLEYRPLIKRFGKSSESGPLSSSTTPLTQWQSQELVCSDNSLYTQHTRDVETKNTNVVEDTYSFTNEFVPEDKTIPPRIVGTQEYSTALEQLEQLVASSSPDEVAVYDKIILQLPEYIFYSGMVAGVDQPKPLAGVDPNKDAAGAKPSQIAGSQFKKQSLAWLMGLARVELGATRSMYLEGDDWFVPTPAVTFGLTEYYHVLLEDVAAHLQALDTDAQFKRAIKKSFKIASSETLAYLRRLKMVSSMLVALEESGAPVIAQRATDFRKEVTDYTEVLTAQVTRSTQNQTVVNRRTNTNTVRGKQVVNETH